MYAYLMLEPVKAINGMIKFMGLGFNELKFNRKLPGETVGPPIMVPT